MPIHYRTDRKKLLFIEHIDGKVSLDLLTTFFEYLIQQPDYGGFTGVITDIREASFTVGIREIKDFIMFLIRHKPDKTIRWALLTDNPRQTAYSLLIKANPFFRDLVGVFTTLEAASEFLSIQVTEDMLNKEQMSTYPQDEFDQPAT